MKLSHNALTFLLAQYRAIFKQAYIKGLAPAVLLTAGLAAGQAATAASDVNLPSLDNLPATGTITITGQQYDDPAPSGSYTKIQTTGGSQTNFSGELIITSGAGTTSNGNCIASNTADTTSTLSGRGTLTINIGAGGNAVTDGLHIAGNSGNMVVDLQTIDVKNGLLLISDKSIGSGTATVSADNIIIGADTGAAYVTLSGSTAKGLTLGRAAVDGTSGSTITVNKGGKLELKDASTDSTNNTIEGALLSVKKDGVLAMTAGNANDINTEKFDVEKDAFHIVSGAGTGISGSFTGHNGDIAGNVLIAAGNSFSFENTDKPDPDDASKVITEGNVTVQEGANFQIGGTLNISGGKVTFAQGANLHATAAASSDKSGSIIVTKGTKEGVLAIDGMTLTQFLTAKDADGNTIKYAAIDGSTETIASKAETDAQMGSVVLNQGRLEITGTSASNSLDLTELTFVAKSADEGTSGAIVINSGTGSSTIYGDYLTLSDKLKSGGTSLTGASSKLLIEAENLTLGSLTVDASAGKDYGFSGATTQNLTVLTSGNGPFQLTSDVTLDVTVGDSPVSDNETGTVTGAIVVGNGGSLTAQHGTFTDSYDLTLNSGSLTVTNDKLEDESVMDTKLTLTGALTLHAGNANSKIEVNGNDVPGVNTILDISQADFSLESGASTAATVEVKSGGTLITNAANLQEMLKDVEGSNSGATVFLSNGTIEVTDNLELNGSQLTSGASATSDSMLTFDSTSGGTLSVDGTFTIKNASTISIGTSSEVIADTLAFYGTESGGKYETVNISSGKYLAQSTLRAYNDTDVINFASAGPQVFLGDFRELEDGGYEVVSETGSIDAKLTLNADDANLTVQNGAWTGSTIDVASGSVNVGLSNDSNTLGFSKGFDEQGVKLDANGEVIGASLKLDALSLGGNGRARIAESGELNVTDLKVTNSASGAFTVAGVANVAGKYTASGDKTPESFGVALTGGVGSIKVTNGGSLSFGDDATRAITLDSAKNTVTVNSAAFGSNIFNVEAGGQIAFSFGANQTFTADALKDLRSKLFTNLSADLVAGTINLGEAQLAGVQADTDGAYSWDKLQGYSDVADFTTDAIRQAVVKDITSTDNVRGHFGALKAQDINAGSQITIVGDTSLNNAADQTDANGTGIFAAGKNNAVLGLNVTEPALVQLNNGGQIGKVTLDAEATLSVNHDQSITAPADTLIAALDGDGTAQFGIGTSTIAGNSKLGNLITKTEGVVNFEDTLTVGQTGSTEETVLDGTTNFAKAVTFNNDTEIGGAANFDDGVTFAQEAGIYGDTTIVGGAQFDAYTEIGDEALLKADSIELTGTGTRFVVGEEDYVENGQTMPGSTGYLEADSFKLGGNYLVVDPAYGHKTSIAYVKNFTDGQSLDDAGIFSGSLIAGMNAALVVGKSANVYDEALSFIENYQNSHGSLVQDEVGAIFYLGDKLTAKTDSRIIIDSQRTQDEIFGAKTITGALNDSTYKGTYQGATIKADLFLGQNTVLGVNENILADGVALHFESKDAAIMAEEVSDDADAAKIVLDGDGFLHSRNITLFTDEGTGSANGVKILGNQDIRVETINGVMYFTLEAGTETTGGELKLDTTKLHSAFLGATDESRELLFAYASQTANFREYYADDNQPGGAHAGAVEREELHGDVAPSYVVTLNKTTGQAELTPDAAASNKYDLDDYLVVLERDEKGDPIRDEYGNYVGTVYNRAYNDLLEAIVRNTDGAATDAGALNGVFGGAAQAALLAARTSQDAIAGRVGVGAARSALKTADNGQGAGFWVSPNYVSSDSDGFAVNTKDYGVDIDLYGVALGGDYTLANGLRLGAFFNIGSGDADGNGQAAGVSNDFDYYGVGLYAGYTVGQFSLVGDVSYSVVDSEVEAATAVGKMSSSFDTDNISVGVTGQYEFNFGGTLVTPHLGLRYSALSFDDYNFKADGFTQGGNAAIDDANVFSIPVGVTIAQEFAFDSWTVKPSLDVTVQGNFGDDELDSSAVWDNVAWQSNYKSEFIDSFTYGATLGIAAQTGAFSAGFGLGYQGSSNTDELSVNANARFTF